MMACSGGRSDLNVPLSLDAGAPEFANSQAQTPCGSQTESCDPTNLGGATCASLGMGTGKLRCHALDCSYDLSQCSKPVDQGSAEEAGGGADSDTHGGGGTEAAGAGSDVGDIVTPDHDTNESVDTNSNAEPQPREAVAGEGGGADGAAGESGVGGVTGEPASSAVAGAAAAGATSETGQASSSHMPAEGGVGGELRVADDSGAAGEAPPEPPVTMAGAGAGEGGSGGAWTWTFPWGEFQPSDG
jgi:hypothetical protein